MFIGESLHTLDSKFRVFVPKRFQSELGRNAEGQLELVLCKGQDSCLYLFSLAGFHKAAERLNTEAFTGEEERNVQRVFFSRIHVLTLDSAGRVLIPEKLRDVFGGERELALIGVMQRAELWPRSVWERIEEENGNSIGTIDRVLCNQRSPERGGRS